MLSSISPLGERARASRWWLTTTAYVLGSLIGGLAVGALAGLLGSLVPESWRSSPWLLVPLAVALLIALALDTGIAGTSLPVWKRQVDVAWLARYRGWVYGLGFGVQLGFGLVTIVTSATTYAMVLFAASSGNLVVGLLIGAAFGLVRSSPSLLMARVDTTADLHRVFARLEKWAGPADVLARVALAGAAATLVVLAAVGS
jgi:sulfite exporter TauE/SafE